MSKKKPKPLPADLELIRLELAVNDCRPPEALSVSREEILEEIGYVLKPKMHERRIPPYGSVICPGKFKYQGASKVSSAPPLSSSFIRMGADGRRTFVVRPGGGDPELWQLDDPCETELDLLNLVRHTGGLALKRIESGLVSLIHDGWAYTIRGREWLARGPISDMADAVRQVAAGMTDVTAVLELCCYVLSPKNLGTTFVYFLKEPTTAEAETWTAKPDIRSLNLEIEAYEDYPQIVHLARHHDGAFLVGPDRRIRSLGGHLAFELKTAALIAPHGGTRHTSAKRYSYEHASSVVFVVSEDGHVSVFSDGARVADSPVLASGEARFLKALVPEKSGDVSYNQTTTTCQRCGKDLAIQIVTVIGWKEREEVSCPVCGQAAVSSAMCWSLAATPIKKL